MSIRQEALSMSPFWILYLTGSAFRFGKKHLIVHSECLDIKLVEVYGNKFYLSLIILFLATLCRVIKRYKKILYCTVLELSEPI